MKTKRIGSVLKLTRISSCCAWLRWKLCRGAWSLPIKLTAAEFKSLQQTSLWGWDKKHKA